MTLLPHTLEHYPLSVLAITQGQWGERIADNIGRHRPPHWTVHRWATPRSLPLIIDDPTDYLPARFPPADLVLALGDTPAVAQLIPDIARAAGAKAVLAPIDRNESLPAGLIKQLRGWLDDLHITSAFPKPFCSLTPETYNLPPHTVNYDDPFIREYARHFGRPIFEIAVDDDKRITAVVVERDSTCGCARHVAAGLVGRAVSEAEHEAGMLHHHFPCLASMNQDADYKDTLMHVSGNILREAVNVEIKDHVDPTPYFRPQGRADN